MTLRRARFFPWLLELRLRLLVIAAPSRFALILAAIAVLVVRSHTTHAAEGEGAAASLMPVDGPAQPASLVRIHSKGELTFMVAGKQRELAARDLVRWGAFRPLAGVEAMLLDDGDVVTGRDVTFDGSTASLRSEAAGEVRAAAGQVAAIVLRMPSELSERDRLLDELAGKNAAGSAAKDTATAPGDAAAGRIYLDNGDIVPAKLLGMTRDEVTAQAATDKLALPRARVRAIAFARAAPSKENHEARLVVGLTDGSRLTAAKWSSDATNLALATASGVGLKAPLAKVVAMQSLGGRAVYLSDLPASGFAHIPYLSTKWPLAIDRSVGGGRLRAGSAEYLKGLGMHSAARATYALDRPYRRFAASVAIDDIASRRGSVQFRAYTDDGSGQWKLRWSSETVRGGDPPIAVEVDLAGAKRLSLVVDFADRADEWDRADWLEARVVE